MPLPAPVIFVPGITATYLKDEYELPPQFVWTVLTKSFERTELHPDDLRYEARQPALNTPGQIYEIAYKELIEEMRHNLMPSENKAVPVYPFGYDWRQPLEVVEDKLAAFIKEIIERTRLIKHYDRAGYAEEPKVNLIGHSMGGLIIGGYLSRFGEQKLVNKVVTLATPFQGSFEAIIKMATGTANIGATPPSSRERQAARITPSLYYLLPSFSEGLEGSMRGVKKDWFKPDLWQPSILKTIRDYIKKHSLARIQAEELFKGLLDAGRKHRARVDTLDLSKAGLTRKDWLVVAGTDTVTRVKLKVSGTKNRPYFDLSSKDRMNRWHHKEDPDARWQTGDGTVPLAGAVPKFMDPSHIVCVTPDDYGYWELQDRTLSATSGFHGILPNMNMLHRMMVQFFSNAQGRYGNTWGRRLPGVSHWNPPLDLRDEDDNGN